MVIKDPAALKVSKFAEISTFLNVFIGLLLGFFMSSSMSRWFSCANGFLELFDAIRILQINLSTLGVPEEKIQACLRYTLLSAWLLQLQLKADLFNEANREDAMERVWDFLRDIDNEEVEKPVLLAGMSGVEAAEEKILRSCTDPCNALWVWVVSVIASLSQDGDVPPMASPTYNALINLSERARVGIRTVRSSASIQAPYIYVQALATLVHVNNAISATSFGMTWGSSLGTTLAAFKAFHLERSTGTEVARDLQNVIISFFLASFGPFLYLALLEVAIAIAQPYNTKEGEVPAKRLLEKLEHDLIDGKAMAKVLPKKWPKPQFKKS
jgi:hypothetical protein